MNQPANDHAERLSWNMSSWNSIELEVHIQLEHKAEWEGNKYPSYGRDVHYIETAAGQRMFEGILRPSGGPISLTIDYTDGKLAAQLLRREEDDEGHESTEQITIKRIFGTEDSGGSHRPQPLNCLYVGHEPLPKALLRARYLGTKRYNGHDCDLFLFREVKHYQFLQDFAYWLDQSTSVPMRIECYNSETARLEDRPVYVWSAETIKEFEGRYLPVEYSLVRYQASSSQPDRILYQVKGRVESVHFDRAYPESTFWPEISEDATVLDYVNNEFRSPKSSPTETAVASSSPPIRATEPGGWFPSLSTTTMALGAAVMAIGLLLWWRRR